MTASNGSPPGHALDAVRRLEGALEAGDQVRVEAEDALSAAREEAARLLADARADGTATGRRLSAEILQASQVEAAAIRAAGETQAKELLRRVSAEQDDLVAELAAIVLARDG